MTYRDLVRLRARVQRLSGAPCRRPADVVTWLCAVQAQDFAGACWALGQRARGATAASVEAAFNAGEILRTHAMRPTWHFVSPADISWLLGLTSARLHIVNGYQYRQHGLDARLLSRSRRLLERALGGGRHLTRAEVAAQLRRGKLDAGGPRLAHVMMHAEQERVVCSGPRRGKQFTYALFDERVPGTAPIDRDEALAELTRRYFSSHGPATIRDFSWWSGLTVREARRGLTLIASSIEKLSVDGLDYWVLPGDAGRQRGSDGAFLLPNYDELLIAYKDRGPTRRSVSPDRFPYHLVIDGRLEGSWRRRVDRGVARIDVATYGALDRKQSRAVQAAAARLGAFLETEVKTTIARA